MKFNTSQITRYVSDFSYLPGHELVLQFSSAPESPMQKLPPFDGGGLLHFRVLFFVPVPQVLVHVE